MDGLIRKGDNVVMDIEIFTIGHSTKDFENLRSALAAHNVDVLVDVRSSPYSRMAPEFNREGLNKLAAKSGVRYIFMGDRLGGRPKDPQHYDEEGRALYGLMAASSPFLEAIDLLIEKAQTNRIALMCSEGKPAECHRELLIGRVLRERGVAVKHILPDGSLEKEAVAVHEQTLFEMGESEWKSVRSVLRPGALKASSQH